MVTRIHAATPASGAPPALPPVVFPRYDPRRLLLQAVLLWMWVLAAFGVGFFARDLQSIKVLGWPLGYWLASQGVVLVFLVIVLLYAVVMHYIDRHPLPAAPAGVQEPPPHG